MKIRNTIFPILAIVESVAKFCQSPAKRTTIYVHYEIEKIKTEQKYKQPPNQNAQYNSAGISVFKTLLISNAFVGWLVSLWRPVF